MADPHPHPFHNWLGRELARTGTSWAAFARKSGIGEPTFNRWKRGEIAPSVDKVRQVTEALELPEGDILRLLVIAQILKPSEVRQQVVVPDPDLLSDEEIVEQTRRRLKRRRDEHSAYDGSQRPPVPLFRSTDT